VEDFTTIETLDPKKSYYHSGPSPMRPNKLWTFPHDGASRAQPLVVVGPFKEEEEGTSITSDVVKVRSEDPDTPGGRVRRDVGNFGLESCMHLPWLAHDQTPVPKQFPNFGLIKRSNTRHQCVRSAFEETRGPS